MIDVSKSLWIKEKDNRKSNIIFLSVVTVIMAIFMVIVLLYTYVFTRVLVVGQSMEPTLYHNEVVVISQNKQIKQFDIVVISQNEYSEEKLIIKRVIAMGGDEVLISQGYVFVNGEKLDEPYLKDEGITYYPDPRDSTNKAPETWIVPEGEIFFLGDNRTNSSDSRTYGTVKEEKVLGVASSMALKVKHISKFIYNVFTFN